eukprot:6386500-Prymnesium_polylepis.1
MEAELADRRAALDAARWAPAYPERPACHVHYSPAELGLDHPPVRPGAARGEVSGAVRRRARLTLSHVRMCACEDVCECVNVRVR